MDIIPFIQFTMNSRYITRWIYTGILIYIPVLNFFSLGYLSKTSRVTTIGGLGLPTWENKYEIWVEGIKVIFIFILYEAVPFFLFSCGFFLTTLSNITAFFGSITVKLSYIALFICSFFLPFALATFSEQYDFRSALEFENIFRGIKEVFIPYLIGYLATAVALYLCTLLIKIPYLVGFLLSSILTYYILLVATYYFTELFKTTTLSTVRITEDIIPDGL